MVKRSFERGAFAANFRKPLLPLLDDMSNGKLDPMAGQFDNIHVVAREMQHLLWRPERVVRADGTAWWNCLQHAVVTAALMWINDYTVEMFAGEAFFAQGPKGNGATACLHQVPRHWWVSVQGLGVIDFSPDLGVPAAQWDACAFDFVFANRVVAAEDWAFHQTSKRDHVQRKLNAVSGRVGARSCIYLRLDHNPFAPEYFLADPLITNANNEPWAQTALLCHLQKLLRGEGDSLRCRSLQDGWHILRSLPQADVEAVRRRFDAS